MLTETLPRVGRLTITVTGPDLYRGTTLDVSDMLPWYGLSSAARTAIGFVEKHMRDASDAESIEIAQFTEDGDLLCGLVVIKPGFSGGVNELMDAICAAQWTTKDHVLTINQ